MRPVAPVRRGRRLPSAATSSAVTAAAAAGVQHPRHGADDGLVVRPACRTNKPRGQVMAKNEEKLFAHFYPNPHLINPCMHQVCRRDEDKCHL